MKIAIIINKLVSAGAERLVVDEIREFERRGIEVHLITLAPERPDDSFMLDVDLEESAIRCVRFHTLYDIAAWRELITLLRRIQPDVLFTHLWQANTVGRIAAKAAGIRRVVSFEHNVYDAVKTRKQFMVDRLLQYWSHRIIAVSEPVRDSLVRHGIDAKRVAVVENGVDLSRYQNVAAGQIGTSGAFTYLFVGRLVRQKGMDILLRAFSIIGSGMCIVVGEGPERENLQKLAQELGIAGRMRWLGVRDDVPGLLKATDCFVLPSRYEGMPIVLIEAMAAGCPCIVSDFPAAHKMLQDNESGLIVPACDPGSLATAMKRVAAEGGGLCPALLRMHSG